MTAIEFYNKYNSCSWVMEPLPSFDNIEDSVRWIFASGFGWIELDVEFDINQWKRESSYCNNFLVPHREGDNHLDWRSCCIHGIGVDKTGIWNKYVNDETDAKYSWTSLSELTENITNFWKSLPFEKYARIRFMEVGPSGYVYPHSDFSKEILKTDFDLFNNVIPINIAVTHPTECFMTLENLGTVPWKDGKVFLVNISQTHSVINFSNQPRLHMIGHGIPGNKKIEFCELLVRSYNKQYERYKVSVKS